MWPWPWFLVKRKEKHLLKPKSLPGQPWQRCVCKLYDQSNYVAYISATNKMKHKAHWWCRMTLSCRGPNKACSAARLWWSGILKWTLLYLINYPWPWPWPWSWGGTLALTKVCRFCSHFVGRAPPYYFSGKDMIMITGQKETNRCQIYISATYTPQNAGHFLSGLA